MKTINSSFIITCFCFTFFSCSKKVINKGGQESVAGQDSTGQSGTSVQTQTFVIPANKSYSEPYIDTAQGIYINQGADSDVVNQWTGNVNDVWYLYFNPGYYKISLDAMLTAGTSSSFHWSIIPADSSIASGFNHSVKSFALNGDNTFHDILIDSIQIDFAGFYKLTLQPANKSGATYASIKDLDFVTSSLGSPGVRFAKYLTSPAVHWFYSTSDGVNHKFEWMYGEVTVPKGYDPLYTFYMCLGFSGGYFGMQTNSSSERRILFSVWNSYNSNQNSQTPDSLKVKSLGSGTHVNVEDFNNEGSGQHAYLVHNWQAGQTVKFLVNARQVANGATVYSAWYEDNTVNDWQYMASFYSPHDTSLFQGPYSFVEDFGSGTGQYVRKGLFGNLWGIISGSGIWSAFSQAGFSHTDGATDSRSDYSGGIGNTTNTYYLQTGGYTAPVNAGTVSLSETQAPNIPFTELNAQVDSAVKNIP